MTKRESIWSSGLGKSIICLFLLGIFMAVVRGDKDPEIVEVYTISQTESFYSFSHNGISYKYKYLLSDGGEFYNDMDFPEGFPLVRKRYHWFLIPGFYSTEYVYERKKY